MPTMTPVRVRGKRGATNAEKWNIRKQRKAFHAGSSASSGQSSWAQPMSSGSRPSSQLGRRRRDPELSRLEELPTEIIQAIFEYSANVNLALASPRLSSQLASPHLYHPLTSRIIEPVLGVSDCTPAKSELADATRLMNSKFFTFSFFSGWLLDELDRRGLRKDLPDAVGESTASPARRKWQVAWSWIQLRPHKALSPPKKLFRGPFTQDKTDFLGLTTFQFDSDHLDPGYVDFVRECLEQAVAEGASYSLFAFWQIGLQPDTELLRHAVIDAGCVKAVVRELVDQASCNERRPGLVHVDFLDPALWAWADRARARDDEKGQWLIYLLKAAAKRLDQSSVDSEPSKDIETEQ